MAILGPLDIRQHLGNNPVHGRMQTERGICLPSGPKRRSGNHAERDDLAYPQTRMGPVAEEGRQQAVQEGPGGARPRRILSSSDHGGRSEGLRPSSPTSLPSFQGADPSGDDGQPRRRQEEAQRSDQSRTRDIFGSADPCHPRSESGACLQSGRHQEQHGEAFHSAGSSDTPTASQRRAPSVDRDGFRDKLSICLEDSPTRAMGGIAWTVVGAESGYGTLFPRAA